MTKLQWAGVGLALGVGVLAQIPRHGHVLHPEHTIGTRHEFDATAEPAVATNGRVTLAVSGMT